MGKTFISFENNKFTKIVSEEESAIVYLSIDDTFNFVNNNLTDINASVKIKINDFLITILKFLEISANNSNVEIESCSFNNFYVGEKTGILLVDEECYSNNIAISNSNF